MNKSNAIISKMQKYLLAVMIFSIAFMMKDITADAYSAHTQVEAIQWLESKLGTGIDADGAYGNQCVDLVVAYYDYMGVPRSSGNAADYTWNTIPSGWQRIQGAVPQPGDVLVYTGGYGGYGHVAIMGNSGASYHQNFNSHSYIEKVTTVAYNGFSTPYWGVIRPDFARNITMYWEGTDCQPSKNDVYVYIKANAYTSGTFTQAGITLWDSAGNVVGSVTEYINTASSYLNIWYKASSDLGKTLQPGKKYSYQIYAVFNGIKYNGPVNNFTTLADESNNVPSVGWRQDSVGWWYRRADGSYPCNCWELISGKWYYFNASGYRVTGWRSVGGAWYFFNDAGVMQTGWLWDNGQLYIMDDNGVMMSNKWIHTVSDKWYYMTSSGAAAKGWAYIGGIWYAFNEDCQMITGWCYDGDLLYYMDNSGAMVSNKWIHTVSDKWYYMTSNGAAAKDWAKIGGVWYYFNSDYQMVTGWKSIGGTRYYFNGSGAMVTGWQVIGGKWYYFHGSGAMATNQWIGNYYLQSDGTMATNKWIGQYYVGANGAWIP